MDIAYSCEDRNGRDCVDDSVIFHPIAKHTFKSKLQP